MSSDDLEDQDGVIPVSDEPIPAPFLAVRQDASWEQESSDTRIALVLDWAAPLLERIQKMGLLGLKTDEDDEFNDLVNEVYDGVRNRLTRQDLIRAVMLSLGEKTVEESVALASEFRRDLRALDRPDVVDRFFRN